MAAQNVFKRYELKYLLTKNQYVELKELMTTYMTPNEYGKYRIHNIYMDTKDYLLIRRSIEKPCYKEKMRIRAYGDVNEDSRVFMELKKKYKGVVYKRRMDLPLHEAYEYLFDESPFQDETQITREIDYFVQHYEGLSPKVLLSYDREAFAGKEDSDFRVTFDQNIAIQDHHVCFLNEGEGTLILPEDTIVLEVKTAMGIPKWLLDFFAANDIYKTSFSKYGTAYKNILLPQLLGEQAFGRERVFQEGAVLQGDVLREMPA